MKKTFKEFKEGLYFAQTDFDQLASWYYELKKENERLQKELIKYQTKHNERQ